MWIVRLEGSPNGVSEGAVFDAGHAAGLVDVKVARWSDTDTGMKFVVPKAKRPAAGRAAVKRKARA